MKRIIITLTAILLFLLPWQTRLIILPGNLAGGYSEYGTVSLYATEIILWLAVILFIADYFIVRRSAAPGAGKRLKIFFFLFSCFFAFLLAHPTLLTLNHTRLFLEGILIFLIIRGIGPKIYLAWAFTPTPKTAVGPVLERHDSNQASDVKTRPGDLLVWGFVIGAALQAVLGIYQFFTQSAFASKWLGMAAHDPSVLGTFVVETASGRWLRAYGALPHPNILAGYLVAAILSLLIINIQNKNVIPAPEPESRKHFWIPAYAGMTQKISLVVLPILFTALFFTFSRSAWIALAVGIIILVIAFRRDAINRVSTILPAFAVILSLLIIYWPLVAARTVADSRLEIKSSSERIGYYSESWTLIKRHPLLGVGLGNYTRAVHDEIDATRPAYAYQPVHNIFVLALAELGIVGILIIAAAILSLCKREYPRFGNRGGGILRKIIPWKKIIYLAPFLIIGLFDHYLWSLYPGIVLWAAYLGLLESNGESTRILRMPNVDS